MAENSLNNHSINTPSYIVDGDPGRTGGGTYTTPSTGRVDPTIQDYENIFGPAARDVKLDLQRHKRHGRWHLPDALKGSNPWIADKIDGLITDTSTSPFTTTILPYMYIENVDQKIKWNRWSFDEGLSSRVPYESAARTLTQTKTSYAGYTVRQGLAMTLEHNFMMSPKGRENFKHQLQQIVGSIQYTNDIDVHVALITAPSYAKEKAEKYFTKAKTNHQIIRQFIDLFGFFQKSPNAMDILIEEARSVLRSWGALEPNFLLTNSKLTFQMTMLPEKTEYITQGPDGQKRLRAGPDITSYRGLKVINSRSFSMEDGAPPRDVLRRRVRTAEYYRIPYSEGVESKHFSFYDESKDSWHKFSWHDLIRMADCPTVGEDYNPIDYEYDGVEYYTTRLPDRTGKDEETSRAAINDGINRLAAANLVPGAAVVPLPARPAPQGMPNPTRTNIKIPGGVFSAMKDPRNLTGFREDDVDLNGGANTWALLSELINRNVAYQIPLPFGAPPTRLDQVDAMGAWGVDATDLASAIQHKYQELASDICAFLLGDVRSMPWARREVLGRINFYDPVVAKLFFEQMFNKAIANVDGIVVVDSDRWEIVVIRPNIEHEMLGIVMGRGGVDELGATLWGQTELSVYDDSMHGIWGMSYKYNERAIVFNHKNMIRLWDIAYDGYNGGKDCTHVNWCDPEHVGKFMGDTYELNRPYEGTSMMVMKFRNVDNSDPWPSPIVFHESPGDSSATSSSYMDGEHQHQVDKKSFRVFDRAYYAKDYKNYFNQMPNFTRMHNTKNAGTSSEENETSCSCLAFQGTMRIHTPGQPIYEEISGNGHHGVDAVGMASVRAGKGIAMGSLHTAGAKPVIIA